MTAVSEYEEKLRSLIEGETQYFFARLEDIKTQVALSHGESTHGITPPTTRYLFTLSRILGIIASISGVAGDANVGISGMSVILPRSYGFSQSQLIFLNTSVILEQDDSNCAQM